MSQTGIQVLKTSEIQQELALTRKTINKYIRSNRLTAFRLGSSYKVPRSFLNIFLANKPVNRQDVNDFYNTLPEIIDVRELIDIFQIGKYVTHAIMRSNGVVAGGYRITRDNLAVYLDSKLTTEL